MIYNFWKRSILTFVVLFAPMLFSMVLLSCRDDDPILEIVGQDIQVLQEGIYTDVLIYVQYKLNEISTSRLFNSNSLLNPLYATSPGPPNIISLITDLNITSPIDFNSDFPAGSELLSIFQIELYQDSDEEPNQDVNEEPKTVKVEEKKEERVEEKTEEEKKEEKEKEKEEEKEEEEKKDE